MYVASLKLRVLAVTGTLALGAAGHTGAALGPDDPLALVGPRPMYAPLHEQPASDPWMPGPAAAGGEGIEHCGPWVRDGYESIQVNVDARGCNIVGDAANETTIAIDPTDRRKIVIGWRQFDTIDSDQRLAGWGYSRDAGRTWTFPGVLTRDDMGSDPVLAADADGFFYYLSMGYTELRLFRSSNGGLYWHPPVQVAPSLHDKPWMAIDQTSGIGRGNIYIKDTYNHFRFFARSTDGGDSFQAYLVEDLPWPTLSVGPDGTVYMVSYRGEFTKSHNAQDGNQAPVFDPSFSVDVGGPLTGHGYPNDGGLIGQTWVATDHSGGPTHGNVYVLGHVLDIWENATDLGFARSTDGGITWSEPVLVNDDPEGEQNFQWFGMISVAPNGRIDAAWNDTRSAGDYRVSELFYSYSIDGGETWSKNIPVSPAFNSYVGLPPDSMKLGDYYHMVSDNLGVNVAYAATFNGEQDIYFLRIGPWDCNGNDIDDEIDIADAGSLDVNANGVPDECEYRGDYDGDGLTTLDDFAHFCTCLTGPIRPDPPLGPGCRLFDIEPDGDVDLADLAFVQRAFNGP